MEISLVDEAKLIPLCVAIQKYYKTINAPTHVLPASLTSVEEIFQLAGVDHLTIAPHLLNELSQTQSPAAKSSFDAAPTVPVTEPGTSYLNDHGRYQITFARDSGGASQRKITEVCYNITNCI